MLLRRFCSAALRRPAAQRSVAQPRVGLSTTTTTTTPPESAETEEPQKQEPQKEFSTPSAIGDATKHSYQAETKSLLRIVSNALYTEREIFLRELVSNACDALEKARQRRVAGESSADDGAELEIKIHVDIDGGELVVEDTGIGMTRDELAENLGTIALSGSKRFVEEARENGGNKLDASAIIGQFGVGFYSAFMVGDEVVVESKAADNAACRWRSADGAESYELEDLDPSQLTRGTRVRITLKDDAKEFMKEPRLKDLIKKYSNFAPFPVFVGSKRANAEDALWTRDPLTKGVTKDEYESFYRSAFKNAWDTPNFTLHFRAEAPIDMKALLYFPSFHSEKAGMARTEPAISLYSRKVLIESPCRDLLPDWLRFVKGVVDSEDLPLSISREKSQDKRLLLKIQDVLVRKVLKFLKDKAQEDRDAYLKFYQEFQVFLKEGVCNDFDKGKDVAKLLYFDTSRDRDDQGDDVKARLSSFDEYVSRLPSREHNFAPDHPEDDGKIYYLHASSRKAALASPYFEPFKKTKRECIFVYNAIDDFVMSNIGTYNDRQIATAETYEGTPDDDVEDDEKDDDDAKQKDEPFPEKKSSTSSLDEEAVKVLGEWMKAEMPDKLESVDVTLKLTDSPAVVVDAESGAMRRMMSMVSQQNTGVGLPPLPPQKLLVNPKHPIVTKLHALVVDGAHDHLAKDAAAQLLDNALIAAGLLDDPQKMLKRLNSLLDVALGSAEASTDKATTPSSSS